MPKTSRFIVNYTVSSYDFLACRVYTDRELFSLCDVFFNRASCYLEKPLRKLQSYCEVCCFVKEFSTVEQKFADQAIEASVKAHVIFVTTI